MTTAEYLEFLDWTAKHVVPGKLGATPEDAPPILQRIGLQTAVVVELVSNFGELFFNVAGEPHEIANSRSRRRGSRFRFRFRVRSQLQAAFAGSK